MQNVNLVHRTARGRYCTSFKVVKMVRPISIRKLYRFWYYGISFLISFHLSGWCRSILMKHLNCCYSITVSNLHSNSLTFLILFFWSCLSIEILTSVKMWVEFKSLIMFQSFHITTTKSHIIRVGMFDFRSSSLFALLFFGIIIFVRS